MPPREVPLTIKDGKFGPQWEPAQPGDRVYIFWAQYAASGRARCKRCMETIDQGAMRLGQPIKLKYWVNTWCHATCLRSELRGDALKKSIYNLKKLKAKDQQAVIDALSDPVPVKNPYEEELDDWKPSVAGANVEPVTSLALPLLPFQQTGVAWMLQQEASGVKGGILADEMGLGKTIQTIGLLLAAKERRAAAAAAPPAPAANGGKAPAKTPRSAGGAKAAAAPPPEPARPTLIIAPASALAQWESEVGRFAPQLKVLVYHGGRGLRKRCKEGGMSLRDELLGCDVVVTTYSMVEYEYRQVVNAAKTPCEYCGRMYLQSTMILHQQYFCGPAAQRSKRLQLREKKAGNDNAGGGRGAFSESAVEKAKKSLGIPTSIPSMTNVYREIMAEAGREDETLGRYDKGERARRNSVEIIPLGLDPILVTVTKSLTLAQMKHKVMNAYAQAPEPKYQNFIFNSKPIPADTPLTTKASALGIKAGDTVHVAFARTADAEDADAGAAGGVKAKPTANGKVQRRTTAAVADDESSSEVSSDGDEGDDDDTSSAGGDAPVEAVAKGGKAAGAAAANGKTHAKSSGPAAGRKRKRVEGASCGGGSDGDDAEVVIPDAPSKPATVGTTPAPPRAPAWEAWAVRVVPVLPSASGSPAAGTFLHELPIPGTRRAKNTLGESATEAAVAKATDAWYGPAGNMGALKKAVEAYYKRGVAGWAVVDTKAKRKTVIIPRANTKLHTAGVPRGGVLFVLFDGPHRAKAAVNVQKETSRAGAGAGAVTAVVSTGAVLDLGSSEAALGMTVIDVKRRVEAATGVPTAAQVVVLGATALTAPGQKLKNSGVEEGGAVSVVVPYSTPPPPAPSPTATPNGKASNDTANGRAKVVAVAEGARKKKAVVIQDDAASATVSDGDNDEDEDEVTSDEETSSELTSSDSVFTSDDDDDSSSDVSSDDDSSTGSLEAPVAKRRKTQAGAKAVDKKGAVVTAADAVAAAANGGGKKATQLVRNANFDVTDSILHSFEWGRLVVDEAHRIKARTNTTAKAVYALESEYKWALSGTPLQNRVGELFSLLRLVRVHPYAYYHCSRKGCDCSALDWKFGYGNRVTCDTCGHPSFSHSSHFNSKILNPISRYGYVGEGYEALKRLREVLERCQLRRTKVEVAVDVQLPPLKIVVHKGTLDERERDFYTSLYKKSAAQFDGYVAKGTMLHNYAHIFELLARLRQAVDHPYLVTDAEGLRSTAPKTVMCGVCGEAIDAGVAAAKAPCRHVFHQECIEMYLQMAKKDVMPCPGFCCDKEIVGEKLQALNDRGGDDDGDNNNNSNSKNTSSTPAKGGKRKRGAANATPPEGDGVFDEDEDDAEGVMKKIDTAAFTSSTKVEDLVKYVNMMPAGDKCIIFSQYNKMVDIVRWRLRREGVVCVRLTGSLSVDKRAEVIQRFNTDPGVRAILLSLRAGGEGINLQAANHVFTIDPWWNPAIEMQAIQRAHRIGQTKTVTAVRFVTVDTIEERMYQLQERKQLVFDGTIDGQCAALSRLSGEDMAFMFNR